MIRKFQDHNQDCWCALCVDEALIEQDEMDKSRQSRQVFVPPQARKGRPMPARKQKRRPE